MFEQIILSIPFHPDSGLFKVLLCSVSHAQVKFSNKNQLIRKMSDKTTTCCLDLRYVIIVRFQFLQFDTKSMEKCVNSSVSNCYYAEVKQQSPIMLLINLLFAINSSIAEYLHQSEAAFIVSRTDATLPPNVLITSSSLLIYSPPAQQFRQDLSHNCCLCGIF